MVEKPRSVEFWLERIVEYADRLASHLAGCDQESFLADRMRVDAACWCISCIGEACGKLLELKVEFESGMRAELVSAYTARNRYVHAYYSLDELQVWGTASTSVPHIAALVRVMIDADRGLSPPPSP